MGEVGIIEQDVFPVGLVTRISIFLEQPLGVTLVLVHVVAVLPGCPPYAHQLLP